MDASALEYLLKITSDGCMGTALYCHKETKEAYILNRLRNERSNVEILRTILSYKKEEMKDL